jgi:hypothetical protein
MNLLNVYDLEKIDNNHQYLFFIWPSGALWWALLRDEFCLTIVICSILSFRTYPRSPPFISASLNGRLLNLPFTLNIRVRVKRCAYSEELALLACIHTEVL